MTGFNTNRFIVSVTAKVLNRRIDDDEFWSDLLRKNLNKRLKNLDPILLVEYFEKNEPFDTIFNSSDLDKIHKIVKGNEDLLVKLKQKAQLKLKSFEWSWIEIWWKKDHPILLGVVRNHPKSEDFKKYLTEQITKLSRNITNSF